MVIDATDGQPTVTPGTYNLPAYASFQGFGIPQLNIEEGAIFVEDLGEVPLDDAGEPFPVDQRGGNIPGVVIRLRPDAPHYLTIARPSDGGP